MSPSPILISTHGLREGSPYALFIYSHVFPFYGADPRLQQPMAIVITCHQADSRIPGHSSRSSQLPRFGNFSYLEVLEVGFLPFI